MRIKNHTGCAAVEIASLILHPRNPNIHSKAQIERLAEIIRYQGWRYPVNVSKRSGFVVSGHGRIEAAKFLGESQVPVSYQDFETDEQEYAAVVSDNAIASWAELDKALINMEIPELGPDFDVRMLGLDDFVLDVSEKNELAEKKQATCPSCGAKI